MQLSDIIALAKAGYKPADVREFLAEEKTPEVKAPEDDQSAGQDPGASSDQPAVSQEDAAAPDDYMKQINDLTAANNKLMEQIKHLQEANSRAAQAAKETKSDQDIIDDLARSFM